MSRFEYLSVLVSIVIAYAMSEALSGWGQMIRVRDRVRLYPLHLGWSILSVVLMVQWWWGGFWHYRDAADLGLFGFLAVLTEPILLVLLAFVLTPHPNELCGRDLRAEYFRNQRWIFGLAALLLVELPVVDAIVAQQPLWQPKNAIRLLAIAVLATLAISKSERLHAALLAVAYGLFFAFVWIAF